MSYQGKYSFGEKNIFNKSATYDTEREIQDEGTRVEERASYQAQSRKRQGEYTIEDYYALPDEHRAELIDGVFYDMSSPTLVHQSVGGAVYLQIANYLKGKKGPCKVWNAPVDVRLDCDDRTIVQPDIIILCDPSKMQRWGIMGAPDFLLEVLSSSTRKKDSVKKLQKYRDAGVREYWMLDPDMRRLVVYFLKRIPPPFMN